MPDGRIIKALSGFYYVQTDTKVYQCRGRGVFRKKNITPLVGDHVTFDISNPDEGYIMEIKQRENELIRPPIANINQAIIVSSAINPQFSTTLLDRFLVLIESKGVKPVIFITKKDKLTDRERSDIERYVVAYKNIGYEVELISSKNPVNLPELDHYFKDKVTVIAGQSGVGKSSFLNALQPSLLLKTAEISTRLGRGKHTTRHVELVQLLGGLVADTPGFSALDFDEIAAGELSAFFPEMREREPYCKFRGCMHDKEPKCAVKTAVDEGEIMSYRYDHYLSFLKEIQSRKPRY
jgi:ribosome biogenesis GTPase